MATEEADYTILHLFADTGIEDEILHTIGDVVRIGINPDTNPFSTVIQADACYPPVSKTFDLVIASPPCQRWSDSTNGSGDPSEHPNLISKARAACQEHGEHYIIENVRDAPLRDPVLLTGGMFNLPIHYPRAFETSFVVEKPEKRQRWQPDTGPLSNQGGTGGAWDGHRSGWQLAKGYNYDWPTRGLKRHAIPTPYLRRLLYCWFAAVENNERSQQMPIVGSDSWP